MSFDNEMIGGVLSDVSADHLNYETRESKGSKRITKTQRPITDEVHIYISDTCTDFNLYNQFVTFNTNSVTKVEIYKKNSGKNTGVLLITLLGIAVVVGGIALLIAAAVSSCPMVYVKSGNDRVLRGDFGGAVYSSLERDDYMPLPFLLTDSTCHIKIANNLPEIQYINLAELWIIGHPEDVNILPDRNGDIHTVRTPVLPYEARSAAGTDISDLVSNKDCQLFLFNDDPIISNDTSAFSSVTVTFPVKGDERAGKLVVTAGNSISGRLPTGNS